MSYVQIILGIFAIIEQVLPLLGGTDNQTVKTINMIITQLENWLPMISKEVTELYEPVKNIINALGSNPATSADALEKLSALDSKLDADFEAAVKDVDPDAVS